jgi:hypothetical protein
MATNRDSKSSSRATGAPGDKPIGSASTGTGSMHAAGDGQSSGGNGQTTGSGLLGGIQQRVTSRVDEQKNRAADGLGGIADVIRNAGNELRGENEALAQYVDRASDQLRRFATTIRERGVADIMDDVNRFARRNPAVFVGGAFLVGLGVARFLKASADRGDDRSYDNFSGVDPMTAGPGTPSYSGDLGEASTY